MKLKAMMLLLTMAFAGITFAGELDDILSKHIEAIGGEKVLKETATLKADGKFVMKSPQGEMEIPFNIAMKGGDKIRFDATMQGMTITQCLNGDKGWQVMPMMGSTDPQDMSEDEIKPLKEQADYRGDLYDWEKKGHKLELIGKEDVEGTEAYNIKLTTKDGDVRHHFLDSEYFLIIKSTGKGKQMGMEFAYEAFPSDYKTVGGFMMAYSVVQKSEMGEMVFQFNTVERNPEVSDDHFTKPAAAPAAETKDNK